MNEEELLELIEVEYDIKDKDRIMELYKEILIRQNIVLEKIKERKSK